MKLKDMIHAGVLLCGLVSAMWAGTHFFASANELRVVSNRLENKIVGDTIQQISERVWNLEKKERIQTNKRMGQ